MNQQRGFEQILVEAARETFSVSTSRRRAYRPTRKELVLLPISCHTIHDEKAHSTEKVDVMGVGVTNMVRGYR